VLLKEPAQVIDNGNELHVVHTPVQEDIGHDTLHAEVVLARLLGREGSDSGLGDLGRPAAHETALRVDVHGLAAESAHTRRYLHVHTLLHADLRLADAGGAAHLDELAEGEAALVAMPTTKRRLFTV